MQTLHEWARFYAGRGWPVFPVYPVVKNAEGAYVCACGGRAKCSPGKHPIADLVPRGLSQATTDTAQIDAWWSGEWAHANVGIVTGQASGLFVVDLDDKEGRDGSENWSRLSARNGGDGAPLEHYTGSGGLHLVYQFVEGLKNSAGSLGVGIDTRGKGGFIVAAPSIHICGKPYAWGTGALEQPLSPPPSWLVETMTARALPEADAVRLEGSHTLTREDLEAFIAFKSKYPDAATHVSVARAVLSGESWGKSARDTDMHAFLGALHNWALDKHGAPLDPYSSSVLFDETCAAVTRDGVNSQTDRHYIADKLSRIAQSLPAYRGKVEAARATRKAETLALADRLLDGLPDVPMPEKQTARARGAKPRFHAVPLDPNPVIDSIVAELESEPHVFCNTRSQLVRLIRNTTETEVPLQMEPVTNGWLRPLLCSLADWYIESKDALKPVPASADITNMVLERRDYPNIRALRGVSLSPFFRDDGTLVTEEGYDAVSGQWLCLQGLKLPPIADQPSRDDAQAAVRQLLDLLCDFTLDEPGMTSVFLSAILTPLARPVHSPMHLVSAPNQGTGKGLACEVALRIAFGSKHAETWPSSDEEQAKVIVTAAHGGAPYLYFDNISPTLVLGGGSLEGAITEGSSGRVLGSSVKAPPLLRTLFMANGNNVRLTPDMARRSLSLSLVPTTANDATRPAEMFKYRDLVEHVTARRGEYLACALTVLRAYYAAGRPPAGTRSISFPAWSSTVASALVWAGEPDPAQFLRSLQTDVTDEGTDALATILETVDTLQKTAPVRPGQLLVQDLSTALGERLADALATLGVPKPDARALGHLMRRLEDKIAKLRDGRELRLRRARNTHTGCWEYTAVPPRGKAGR